MTTPVPASEFVTFLQHQLPGLDSGAYQLTVGQHVNDEAGAELSGQPLSRSYTFAVKGDRFGLSNPSATIASVFPASNATGEFTTALPHVVFTAASFPWSRYPTKEQPVPPVTGEDTEGDVPTWLAVLLLDDDDAAAYPGLTLDPVTASSATCSPPSARASTATSPVPRPTKGWTTARPSTTRYRESISRCGCSPTSRRRWRT